MLSEKSPLLLILFLSFVSAYVFRDFLALEKLYLFKDVGSDSLNQVYPHLVHISNYLREVGFPQWSFNQGMGKNVFPGSFNDPFTLILLGLGAQKLGFGLAYVEVLKVLTAGVVFYFYLRTMSLGNYPSILGAILFAFSGYMIVGGAWFFFSVEAIYIALLLLSFELIFSGRTWTLFPMAIALIAASQPFYLYLYGVFMSVYFAFRYLDRYGMQFDALPKLLGRFSALALLGLGISAVFLFSDLEQILNSPRLSGGDGQSQFALYNPNADLSESFYFMTALARFFSNDLLGTGSDFRGWYNYLEAPLYCCGLLPLLLAPQAFVFLDRRRKLLYSLFALIILIPVAIPPARHALWLFSGDYHRGLGLMVIISMLLFSVRALNSIIATKTIHLPLLLITCVSLLMLLQFPFFPERNLLDQELKWVLSAWLVLHTVLLACIGRGIKTRALMCVLLAMVLCEVAYSASVSVNNRIALTTEEYQQRTGYNDHTREAIDFLSSRDDGFYRVTKDYSSSPALHLGLNDSLVQGYRGTSSYHSFNQLNYVRFLGAVGILDPTSEPDTRWLPGLEQHPTFYPFGSVKYHIAKSEPRGLVKAYFSELKKMHGLTLYESTLHLPLGYTYDHYISESDFLQIPNNKKPYALYRAVVIDDNQSELAKRLQPLPIGEAESAFGQRDFTDAIRARKHQAMTSTGHGHNFHKGHITLNDERVVFFSIPFDSGWSAQVDGVPSKLHRVNIGFMGLLIGPGRHQIELNYTPSFLISGAAT